MTRAAKTPSPAAIKENEQITKYGRRALGKTELIQYNEGKRLSPRARIRAKCYDCMGYYADGIVSCGIPLCSLFPDMPYRKQLKQLPIPTATGEDNNKGAEQKAEDDPA